jgi:alkylation response protein AidB-like acyl-CoA dehydrogenase
MRIEQMELVDAVRPIFGEPGPETDRSGEWGALCAAGWLGLSVPEAQGGLGQPLAAAAWLHAETGRAVSPAPLLAALAAVDAISACPPSDARDAALQAIVGGDASAVSLLDPAAASLSLADGVLKGGIAAIAGSPDAANALVAVAEPPMLALVPLDHTAVSLTARPTWDISRHLSDLGLDGIPVSDITVLADGLEATAAINALSVHLHFGIAADCVGGAEAALDMTVAYLKERRQFDRPLAMFQALQHRCADLKVAVAAAQALLASRTEKREGGDGAVLARGTKAFASATFRAVAEEAVQMHGGMGMTMEHPCHLYLKRALLNEHLASANDACDLAVANSLMDEDA